MSEIRVTLHLTPHLEDMLRDIPYRLDLVVPSGTSIRELLHKAGIPLPAVYNVIQGKTLLQRDDPLFHDTDITLLATIVGG